jgi:hypothetical protein
MASKWWWRGGIYKTEKLRMLPASLKSSGRLILSEHTFGMFTH